MKLPRFPKSRRAAQVGMTLVVAAIGIQFSFWILPHLGGRWPSVPRPAGVEGFLPIDAMLASRHLVSTGLVDQVHPAGLAIFLGVCLMSAVVARSFCSHLCPVGWISEELGRLGIRLFGRNFALPRWIDLPLRGIKWFLLGFFAWAVWFAMDPAGVAAFLESPYAKMADAKMWLFFARADRVTFAVLGILGVGSLFVRDAWCRYLCPYGALAGLLGRLAPFKVTRDATICIDCRACTKVCPARLEVHAAKRVSSVECTSCQDCVVACPVRSCLAVRPPAVDPWKGAMRPALATAIAVGLWLSVVATFRFTGHWRSAIPETEYHRRLQQIDSPVYSHAGGRAMQEPPDRGAAATPAGEPTAGSAERPSTGG